MMIKPFRTIKENFKNEREKENESESFNTDGFILFF